jgi:hypothetical protein
MGRVSVCTVVIIGLARDFRFQPPCTHALAMLPLGPLRASPGPQTVTKVAFKIQLIQQAREIEEKAKKDHLTINGIFSVIVILVSVVTAKPPTRAAWVPIALYLFVM